MSVIYIVLPLALLFAAGAVAAFIWSARAGQFDDLSTPGVRVALDDEDIPANTGRDDGARIRSSVESHAVLPGRHDTRESAAHAIAPGSGPRDAEVPDVKSRSVG